VNEIAIIMQAARPEEERRNRPCGKVAAFTEIGNAFDGSLH
jgi:hypothetical protein